MKFALGPSGTECPHGNTVRLTSGEMVPCGSEILGWDAPDFVYCGECLAEFEFADVTEQWLP